jgi:Ca2+-binding RTX toxin-like protein
VVGGDVAAINEVHTYVLDGAGGVAGATFIIDGFTVTVGSVVQGVAVATGDGDAIGAAVVRQWGASPASFINSPDLQSITYDAGTNALAFTFKASAGNVANTIIGASAGSLAAIAEATTPIVEYSAASGSADTFVVVGSVSAVKAADYGKTYSSQEALNAVTGNAPMVDLATELLTAHTTTDVLGNESIDGGLGADTLHVFGDADLTTTTLTSIESIQVHSTLRLTLAQINALVANGTTITFDAQGDGRLIISGTTATPLTATTALNLTGLGAMTGLDSLVLSGLSSYTGTISTAAGFPATALNALVGAGEVHTYALGTNTGLAAGAGRALTINGVTVTEGVAGIAEDNIDAIGAAFAATAVTSFTATPNLASVAYNSSTDVLTFTFKASAGNVADAVLGAATGTGSAGTGAETATVQGPTTATVVPAAITVGSAGVDYFWGTSGDDAFTFATSAAGADFIYGLEGDDTITYALEADLWSGTALVDAAIQGGANGLAGDKLLLGTAATAFSIPNTVTTWTAMSGIEKLTVVPNTAIYTIALAANASAVGGLNAVDLSGDTNATGANSVNVSLSATGYTLTGSAGNDTFTGVVAVADTFNVAGGTDTITNLSGSDVLKVAAGATATVTVSAAYTAGVGTTNLGTANLTSAGFGVNLGAVIGGTTGFSITNSGAAATLVGSAFGDTITGGAGADTITGGAGADTITLGLGADTLVLNNFATADTIADYAVVDDSIQLSKAVFTALGALGTLTAAEFVSGAGTVAGADATDRIAYNLTNGDLYYDADGSGVGAAVLIGTFTGAPALVVTEFTIVA